MKPGDRECRNGEMMGEWSAGSRSGETSPRFSFGAIDLVITWKNEVEAVKFWREDDNYHLDVRPLLEKGGEPYQIIMDSVGQMSAADTLHIHALFDPKPLRRVLGQMGFQVDGVRQGEDHWVLTVRTGAQSS